MYVDDIPSGCKSFNITSEFDVNGNGCVNVFDAVALVGMILTGP